MKKRKVLIVGAAGRDFHNFNICFRDNPDYEVVGFTAAQIPFIDKRTYPSELAGNLYPQGISVFPEEEIDRLIEKYDVDEIVFSYTDISHTQVMNVASRVLSRGADFRLMSPKHTMLESKVPVLAIVAVRTGCGKSPTSRRVCGIIKSMNKKPVVIRHPMPYGRLVKQTCERFASFEDLDKYECTVEEREEYEPHILQGTVVYAGVDYAQILHEAEKEADVIVWDGGNNDFPFIKPGLSVVVLDPHRPGEELRSHAGEINFRMAQVAIINKVDTALLENITIIRENIRKISPEMICIEAASAISVDHPEDITGKKVLAVEDGPTLTHGGMKYGSGYIAATRFGATEIIDPRSYAVGTIKETFQKYPETGPILPAMGYSDNQIKDLETTINSVPCDTVIVATPANLSNLLQISKQKKVVRVSYELQEIGKPNLEEVIEEWLLKK